MKSVVIIDSDLNSTHPMEAVMERRGFVTYRSATAEEAIAICQSKSTPIDLAIAEVPLGGSGSQTEVAVRIRRSCPDLPLLLVSDMSLDLWSERDYRAFGELLTGRIDLLHKPLSEGSFMAKANALLYTITYLDSKKLFEAAGKMRAGV